MVLGSHEIYPRVFGGVGPGDTGEFWDDEEEDAFVHDGVHGGGDGEFVEEVEWEGVGVVGVELVVVDVVVAEDGVDGEMEVREEDGGEVVGVLVDGPGEVGAADLGGVEVDDVAEVDGEVEGGCAVGGVVGESVEEVGVAVEGVLVGGADVGVGEGSEAEMIWWRTLRVLVGAGMAGRLRRMVRTRTIRGNVFRFHGERPFGVFIILVFLFIVWCG